MEGDRKNNSLGPVIGTIIILALILIGGLYFWGARAKNDTATEQSSSDDAASIQSDLNATEIDGLDAGIQQL